MWQTQINWTELPAFLAMMVVVMELMMMVVVLANTKCVWAVQFTEVDGGSDTSRSSWHDALASFKTAEQNDEPHPSMNNWNESSCGRCGLFTHMIFG